jgi:hypothetical protein
MVIARVLKRRSGEEHLLPGLPVDGTLQIDRRITRGHRGRQPRPRAVEALAVQVERAGRGNKNALEGGWQRVAHCLGRGPRTEERDGHTGRQATRLRPSTKCAIHLHPGHVQRDAVGRVLANDELARGGDGDKAERVAHVSR